jgi:N-terminal domain of reverse transcriptase
MTPELTDKLDAAVSAGVSGPEGEMLDWRQIDWRRAEDQVRRLRQRIFAASKAGDLSVTGWAPSCSAPRLGRWRSPTRRPCASTSWPPRR